MSLIKLALHKIEIDNMGSMRYGGYATIPNPFRTHDYTIKTMNPKSFISKLISPFHSMFDNQKTTEAIHNLGIKHELSEVKFGRANSLAGKGMIQINRNFQPVGKHFSLGVLGEESNNILNETNIKAKNRFQKTRYLTGESDILKNITGKRYGLDKFEKEDIKKLFKANTDNTRFGVHNLYKPSKTLIGTGIGALTGGLIGYKKKKDDGAIIGTIGGGILGGQAEKFLRTNILKLHKR